MKENNAFDLWKKYEYNSTEAELKNPIEEECTCLCLDPESSLFQITESEPCLTKPCSECENCHCDCKGLHPSKITLVEQHVKIREENEYSCNPLFYNNEIFVFPYIRGNRTDYALQVIGWYNPLLISYCPYCPKKLPHPREDTETSRTYKTIRSERKTPLDD